MNPQVSETTELLLAWANGDEHALEALTPRIYRELRRTAANFMKGERAGLSFSSYLRCLQSPEWTLLVLQRLRYRIPTRSTPAEPAHVTRTKRMALNRRLRLNIRSRYARSRSRTDPDSQRDAFITPKN